MGSITVAAAMSLRNVMPGLVEDYRRRSGADEITVTYGATGDLRRQVEAGAPIDAVVFAGEMHVDGLAARHLVAGTPRTIAVNALVLVGPRGGAPLTFAGIEALPAGELLAIGEPESVPAGHYAREALRGLGKWDAMQGRLVYGGHVAAVLQYVRRGEVAAGIVYETDVIGIDEVVVLDRARGAWAPPIATVAAVIAGGREPAAGAFLDFLASPVAQEMLAAHGFGAAAEPTKLAAP